MPTSRPEMTDPAPRIIRQGVVGARRMALTVALLSALPALAQPPHPQQQVPPGQSNAHGMPLFFATAKERVHAQNHPECTCRAGGENFQLGAQICIGNQIVRCAMDLNVTSWKSVGSACPQS